MTSTQRYINRAAYIEERRMELQLKVSRLKNDQRVANLNANVLSLTLAQFEENFGDLSPESRQRYRVAWNQGPHFTMIDEFFNQVLRED